MSEHKVTTLLSGALQRQIAAKAALESEGTVADLVEIAEEAGIPIPKRGKKEEIREAIADAGRTAAPANPVTEE